LHHSAVIRGSDANVNEHEKSNKITQPDKMHSYLSIRDKKYLKISPPQKQPTPPLFQGKKSTNIIKQALQDEDNKHSPRKTIKMPLLKRQLEKNCQ